MEIMFTEIPWTRVLPLTGAVSFFLAMLYLARQLQVNGKALQKLAQDRKLAEIAYLASSMGQIRNDFGGVSSDITRLLNLEEQVEILGSQITGLKLEVETPVSAVEPSEKTDEALDHWGEIRDLWAKTRMQIEATIETLDGRVRRKYAREPRYNYNKIIDMLRKDGCIEQETASYLNEMSRLFLTLRRKPQATNIDQLNLFSSLWKKVHSHLEQDGKQEDNLESE